MLSRVVDDLFVVVCGCGPLDKLRYLLLYVLCASWGGGVSESVGVSCGCLGR